MSADSGQRQFQCGSCQGLITIPANLPTTTAPCPICGTPTTSPEPLPQGPTGQEAPFPQAQPTLPPAEVEGKATIDPAPQEKGGNGILLGIAGLALFLGLIGGGYFLMAKFRVDPIPADYGTNPSPAVDGRPPVSSESTWRAKEDLLAFHEAKNVLEAFLTAETAEEKAKYILGGAERLDELREFYSSEQFKDDPLAAENFTSFPMQSSDLDRGIYLMDYHRPKQFKFSEFFRPVPTLEQLMEVESASILVWPGALKDNFEMAARRARAFFKKVDGVYKLDWDTLVQTQFRTFRDFTDFPVPGGSGVFRLFIIEDVTTTVLKDTDNRIFRMIDAAYVVDDQITVEIANNSEVGRLLDRFTWTDKLGAEIKGTTVTLRLRWSSEVKPKLQIDKVICWEFLGVGGDPSNLSDTSKLADPRPQ